MPAIPKRSITGFSGRYAFLSNYSDVPEKVRIYGFEVPTVEHGFQLAKSTTPTDRLKIALLSTASEAKAVGRKVDLRPDWETVKEEVMWFLLTQKFAYPGAHWKWDLLNTDDAELIEGNTWGDTYWGVCLGVGKNRLGKMLMKIREMIKEVY